MDITGYQISLSATSATYDNTNHLPTVTLKKNGAADIAAGNFTAVWKNSADAVVTTAIGAGTYTVTVTADNTNTTGALAVNTKTFTINKKNLVLVVSDLATPKIYGFKSTAWTNEVDNVWEVSAVPGEGFVTGDGASADDLTVVADWGNDINTSNNKGYYNAGEHTFTLTVNALPNYAISFQPSSSAKWFVDKKDLAIVANDINLTYGDELEGNEDVQYLGFEDGEDETALGGTLAFTTNYEVGKPVSGNPYSYMPGGLTSTNYNITFNNGNITVNPKSIAELTIADFAPATYNKHDQKPTAIDATFINKKLVAGDTKDYVLRYYGGATFDDETGAITGVTGSPLTSFANAGTYYVMIEGVNNFNKVAYKAFTINKKPLAVITNTIDNNVYTGAAQNINTANVFTTYVTFDGLVEADDVVTADVWGTAVGTDFGKSALLKNASTKLTLTLTKSGSVVTAKDVDNYTITVSGAADAFTNYAPTYVSTGLFKITKKTFTVTAKNQSKKHGEVHPLDAAEGVQTQGDDDTVGDYYTNWVTMDPTVVTGVSASIDTYPVVKKSTDGKKTVASGIVITDDATGDDITNTNFDVKYNKGNFTEGKGTISIIANNASITYGEEEPAMTATIAGLAEGELTEAIQTAVNGYVSIVEDDHTDAGNYNLTISPDVKNAFPAAILANYDETINLFYSSATYTVNKKALTKITANTQPLYVGEAQSDLVVDENTITIEGALEGDLDDILAALDGTLKFAIYVNKVGVDDPVLTDVPDADVAGKFIKATNTYLKGIEFNTAVNLGNYLFPAASKIFAGNLIVTENADLFTLDATKTDNATKINGIAGQKRDVQIKGRTLQANKWNALSLPFDISVRDLSATLGYAIVDRFQQTGDKLNFKIFIGQIPAYTPFLVKVDEAVDMKDITFEDVVVKATETVTEENATWKFINTFDKGVVDGLVYYITPSKSESAVYLDHKTSPELTGFYAYFKTQTGQAVADARIYIEEPDGSTTAISSINADGVAVKAEGWYTIDGIRLQGAPTEKGVYINNGKKIVVK